MCAEELRTSLHSQEEDRVSVLGVCEDKNDVTEEVRSSLRVESSQEQVLQEKEYYSIGINDKYIEAQKEYNNLINLKLDTEVLEQEEVRSPVIEALRNYFASQQDVKQ